MEGILAIFVPISMFIMIFGICAVVMFYRHRGRQELQLTVRSAIDSGQALSAEVLGELTAALHPKKNDLRRGMVLVAIGLAFVALGYAIGQDEAVGPLLGVSAFPFFTGIAYLVLWFLNRDQPQQS
jgi:hypothetical protein